MSNCIYLKKRKNKPYCNIIKKEITLSQCRECDKKEYRFPVKGKIENRKNVKINNKKCTIFVKNRSFLRKNAQNNQKNVQYLSNGNQISNSAEALQISAKTLHKMKKKSKKLAKLERNRFSVFTDDDKCFVCGSKYLLTWNEIYRGKNRPNSMVYGFCLRMCLNCHQIYQEDIDFNDYWHKKAQRHWESNIGSREQFIATFRRNYLK